MFTCCCVFVVVLCVCVELFLKVFEVFNMLLNWSEIWGGSGVSKIPQCTRDQGQGGREGFRGCFCVVLVFLSFLVLPCCSRKVGHACQWGRGQEGNMCFVCCFVFFVCVVVCVFCVVLCVFVFFFAVLCFLCFGPDPCPADMHFHLSDVLFVGHFFCVVFMCF